MIAMEEFRLFSVNTSLPSRDSAGNTSVCRYVQSGSQL
jgi:hypothetical protein